MAVYCEVTAAQFRSLQTTVLRRGVNASGNAGVIRKLGAVVGYSYSPEAETLAVDVRRAPWMTKLAKFAATVDGTVRQALEAEGWSAPAANGVPAEAAGEAAG